MINTPDNLSDDGVKVFDIIKNFLKGKIEEYDVDTGDPDNGYFYSPSEWSQRGEDYGTKSLLIVTYDGSELARFFSMDECYNIGSYDSYEALQECLNESGYFFEECTCWYSAIYKV